VTSRVAGIYSPLLSSGGGAEATVLRAAQALDGGGHRVIVFSPGDVDRERLERHFGTTLARIQFVTLPDESARWASLPVAIRQALLDHRRTRFLRSFRLGLFVNAAFKSNIPGVGAHNVYYTHFPHHLRAASNQRVRSAYLRSVNVGRRLALHPGQSTVMDTYDVVLANSEFTQRNIAARWGRDARVVYPPCEIPETLSQEPRDKTIVTLGRFQPGSPGIPHKSQATMIRAFREMPDLHHAGWRLVLVGALGDDDASQDFFRSLIDCAADSPVEFRPNASRKELECTLNGASVYWHAQGVDGDPVRHPETQEHFGIAVVEAMAHGLVPLVYGSAGPHEIVSRLDPALAWQSTEELKAITRDVIDGGQRFHSAVETYRAARFFSAERFDRDFLTACDVDPSLRTRP